MLDDLYLIAHSVRGEPAFDIALRCEDMGTPNDEGPWWIIPTSGHRAYPIWQCELKQLLTAAHISQDTGYLHHCLTTKMADAIDHYWHSGHDEIQRRYDAEEGRPLLEKLGLIKPPTPINRRSL